MHCTYLQEYYCLPLPGCCAVIHFSESFRLLREVGEGAAAGKAHCDGRFNTGTPCHIAGMGSYSYGWAHLSYMDGPLGGWRWEGQVNRNVYYFD
jgi:hypothetical protein